MISMKPYIVLVWLKLISISIKIIATYLRKGSQGN